MDLKLAMDVVGSDSSGQMFRGVGAGFQELTKLALDCTKAFEDQAKADRQLERYAGDLTGVFKAQATAMQEQLGVSDDMVEKMQTMLLRFGEAPDQVEATTRALLDYSAATGTDAVQATSTLLSSVNSGKAAFKDLGLVYDSTGHKSADLVAVTNALAGKVGGSAKAEAGSLSGQTRIAQQAFEEMKESLGGLIVEMSNKTGIVQGFTLVLREMQEALTGDRAAKASQHQLEMIRLRANVAAAADSVADSEQHLQDVMSAKSSGPSQIEQAVEQLNTMKRLLSESEAAYAKFGQTGRTAGALPGVAHDELTNKGKKAADKEANDRKLSDFESYVEAKTRADFQFADDQKKALDDLAADRDRALVEDQKRFIEEEAADDKHFEKRREQIAKLVDYQLDVDEKALKAEAAAHKKLDDQMAAESKRTTALMQDAATQIGLTFANALAGALAEALSGGEVDAIGVAADIGFSIAAIAASTIANIYAPGTGTLIGGLIGTAGSVVHGVRSSAWKAEQAAKKKHDGGWVGPDRYHSGGWPGLATDEEPIIAQSGEAVLSRGDVQRMGGRSAVDRARRGGGGMNVTVYAQDTESVREFFENRGGRGFHNALRTGRGDLMTALGF